jgi:membrane fusion protein, heavy metal efflux system
METKMKNIAILLVVLISCMNLYGHDGHSHAPVKAESDERSYFTTEAASASFELLATYPEVRKGVASEFRLFISDYSSNQPLDSAEITITSPDDPAIIFSISRERAGIYAVQATFPEEKTYPLHVNIRYRDAADLIALSGITVGLTMHQNETTGGLPSYAYVLLFAGGLLLGIVIMTFIGRSSRNGKAYVLLFIFLANIAGLSHPAFAHGDENHSQPAAAPSDLVYIPKETQFLFGIKTHKMKTEDFLPGYDLQARIIPSPTGQAIMRSTQDGSVISVAVKPGQFVLKGQLLAVIEPVISAADMISFTAAQNATDAEYEAARKEYERLNKLQGITSVQETEAAYARYQTAASNKELLDGLAAGSSDPSRFIYLRAPISGTLEYFSLSEGYPVTAGEPLLTITDLTTVYAEITIYNSTYNAYDSTSVFGITTDSSAAFSIEAKYVSHSGSVNPMNQAQTMILEVNNKNKLLKIGQFVTVNASKGNSTRALVLPTSGITEINGKPAIFTKYSAEQFSVRYITTGEDNVTTTAITSGLEPDERVAIGGTYQLKTIYLTK